MADVVPADVRSRMMSGIRGKNTKPEMIIRRGLHARGFRYVLHDRRLPGRPDIVFPKYQAVIFVHGCFWHGHDCHLFKWPKTRKGFWRRKIARNKEIDANAVAALTAAGWRSASIWECAIKGRTRVPVDVVIERLARWLISRRPSIEIAG